MGDKITKKVNPNIRPKKSNNIFKKSQIKTKFITIAAKRIRAWVANVIFALPFCAVVIIVCGLIRPATARKLTVIIWNMLTKSIPYSPPSEYVFLYQKRKLKMVRRIKRNIAKFEIKPEDVEFNNTLNISS